MFQTIPQGQLPEDGKIIAMQKVENGWIVRYFEGEEDGIKVFTNPDFLIHFIEEIVKEA